MKLSKITLVAVAAIAPLSSALADSPHDKRVVLVQSANGQPQFIYVNDEPNTVALFVNDRSASPKTSRERADRTQLERRQDPHSNTRAQYNERGVQ
jgi:hypothetical protein